MVNIIPKLTDTQISEIEPKSEQKVYKALYEQLPNNWLVVHSLEFIKQTSKHKSHGDREADFVIFAPKYGVLVIEVKGGGIEYDNQINQWYSIDRYKNKHKIKNPLEQAKDAKYEIRNHLAQKGKRDILIAHGALFPDLLNTNPLSNPAIPNEILGGINELDDLKSWIISIFEYWSGTQPNYNPLEINGVNIANQIYGKQVSIQQSLASIIEQEIEQQIILTKQQKNILRQLKRRKEAIIEGGAGTGKTVLALDHAQTLSKQGLKVLLLCYNEKLGNVLKEKSEEYKENLHSMNFHEFCSWRIRQVKSDNGRDLLHEVSLENPDENKFDVWMPDALIESYDISPIRYDVIIIDEGQDFKDEYWLAIEELRDKNSNIKLYIFQDGNQSIYTSTDELPINNEPLYLDYNCRNTKPIHELAYQYYPNSEIEAPEIEGDETKFIIDSSIEKQAIIIDKKVAQLINEEGIKPKEISVIVMSDFYKAEELLSKSRNKKLWAFKEFSPKDKVLVETAKRFKGLESNIIFLWILNSSNMNNKMLYISISRARFRLFIVGDESIEGIQDDER